jgi:AP endonuclease 2
MNKEDLCIANIIERNYLPQKYCFVLGFQRRDFFAYRGEGRNFGKRAMELISWNVNGIKACVKRKGFALLSELVEDLGNPDILCFQETKLTKGELDSSLACVDGYNAFYSFSKKGKHLSGYSGTVTLCRKSTNVPIAAEEGVTGILSTPAKKKFLEPTFADTGSIKGLPPLMLDAVGENSLAMDVPRLRELDSEGRCVCTDHGAFVLFNCYCPALTVDAEENPDQYEDRRQFRLDFLNALSSRAVALISAGRHVVICGDLNVTHSELDYAWKASPGKPKSPQSQATLWFRKLLHLHFADSFRAMHPRLEKYSCWSMKTGARKNNYGCRLDFFLVSRAFFETVREDIDTADVLDSIEGSDHCPVILKFSPALLKRVTVAISDHVPDLSVSKLRKFSGQTQIRSYFAKGGPSDASEKKEFVPRKAAPRQKSLFEIGLNRGARKSPVGVTKKRKRDHFNSTALNADSMAYNVSDRQGNLFPRERQNTDSIKKEWENILKLKAPTCKCGIIAILRVSNTKQNKGKRFFVCANPPGKEGTKGSRCDFFAWK